jgi:cysteine synthase
MPAEDAASHGIQGINDGDDFLVDKTLIDEELIVSTQEAKERAARLAKENGLLVGISSGANVLAAERWIKENNPDGVVVTFLCDRGERYLSCM